MTGNDLTPRQFVESLLPYHYTISEGISGCISCRSRHGIEDESKWQNFMEQVRKYFGKSLKEVYHHTCTNHVRFSVYYSYHKLNNIDFEHKLLPHETRNDKTK